MMKLFLTYKIWRHFTIFSEWLSFTEYADNKSFYYHSKLLLVWISATGTWNSRGPSKCCLYYSSNRGRYYFLTEVYYVVLERQASKPPVSISLYHCGLVWCWKFAADSLLLWIRIWLYFIKIVDLTYWIIFYRIIYSCKDRWFHCSKESVWYCMHNIWNAYSCMIPAITLPWLPSHLLERDEIWSRKTYQSYLQFNLEFQVYLYIIHMHT